MNTPVTERARGNIPLLLALSAFLIHAVTNWMHVYDFFRDEFYYIACSNHLDWGYVDQPPLSIAALWLNRKILGDSLFALRFPTAVASAALVYLTALIVKELGGGRKAQALVCLSIIIAPIYLILDDFYSMNAFELLFWTGAALILIRILNTGNQKLWLLFGLIAGFGLQNKHSMAFFGLSIVVGLLLSRHRKHFSGKWIWLGGAIAALIFMPNLIWQATHGWASLEFMQNAQRLKSPHLSILGFLLNQVLFQHPVALPLWAIGLVALFAHKEFTTYRP